MTREEQLALLEIVNHEATHRGGDHARAIARILREIGFVVVVVPPGKVTIDLEHDEAIGGDDE